MGPPDMLHDYTFLIQLFADVALDNGFIRLVLGNFTNYMSRP
jgi:hypothetical protein